MSFGKTYFILGGVLLAVAIEMLRTMRRQEQSLTSWVAEVNRRDAEDGDTDAFYELAFDALEDEDERDVWLCMRNEILSLPEKP